MSDEPAPVVVGKVTTVTTKTITDPPSDPPVLSTAPTITTPFFQRSAVIAWIDNTLTTAIGVTGAVGVIVASGGDWKTLKVVLWSAGISVTKDALGALKSLLTTPESRRAA